LKKAREISERENGQWAVATFDANPQLLLGNGKFCMLFNGCERDFFAACLDIPKLLKLPFTEELASLSPAEFMQLMEQKHDLTGIVVGENFRFGAKRAGDTEFLACYCAGKNIALEVVPSVKIGEKILSSTLIREMVSKGKIEQADNALAFPYFITGEVMHGEGRGHKLGFPTANLAQDMHKLYPAFGSYATLALVGHEIFPSVTNIGINPTFEGKKITCETHIIDFNADLYGKKISVFFIIENRSEIKFENIAQLTAQLTKDVERAYGIATGFMAANQRLIHKIKTAVFDI